MGCVRAMYGRMKIGWGLCGGKKREVWGTCGGKREVCEGGKENRLRLVVTGN